MLLNWKEFLGNAVNAIGTLAKGNPKLMQGLGTLDEAAQAKGALDPKTRELIALAVASTTRCDTCIAVHVSKAVEFGATRDELMEALSMAVALNAGAAFVYSSHALEAFDQMTEK
ncbi:carboxymuconolactone decarboxylase family protein [Desulfovibrio inopinatus]|uniref:carboxymuconolactone decarboxylase family protein n=1 Tax=Desulfovibrio inopinatus TaxID=102109 RepID=UPI0004023EE1|nr:carboxymuconolactone decarboxylase family protein [Desulfovibrio inopinatus]